MATPVDDARSALLDARTALIDALYAYEVATDALAKALRSGDAAAEQTAFTAAEAAFQSARADEAQKVTDLQTALANWLPDGTTLANEYQKADGTSPIVLLPLRIETRFADGFLKVRLSPDEIAFNTHETALTPEEQQRAKAYYTALNETGGEAGLWRDLVARYGAPRAAYILREMLPTFGVPGGGSSSSPPSVNYCEAILPTKQKDDLTFPSDLVPSDVHLRASSWTRPGEAVMPDRFVVYVYKNGVRREPPTIGNRVLEPLAVTPDPKMHPDDPVDLNGYTIDPNLQWTLDFDTALSVGMGIQVPLVGDDATTGFSRVLVFGIKSSMDPMLTSGHLERLVDAHHYTDGVACIRQGSPTKNTENRPTDYPLKENAGERTFAIEREHPPLDRKLAHHCLQASADGYHLGVALGVPSGVFSNVERSREQEQGRAYQMNTVIWPGTLGFTLKYLLNKDLTNESYPKDTIRAAYSYFQNYVRARGIAPAFRVGTQAYGVIPIGAVASWTFKSTTGLSDDEKGKIAIEQGLKQPLLNLLEVYREAAASAPRILPGRPNPDVDAAVVLATHPSARQFRVRYGVGIPVQTLFYQLFGWDIGELVNQMDQQSQDTFSLLRVPGPNPLGRMQWSKDAQLFTGDIVASTLSEEPGTAPEFMSGVANETIHNLNLGLGNAAPPATPNLLYTVLRHTTLMAYYRIQQDNLPAATPRIPFFDIFGLVSQPTQPIFTTDFDSYDPFLSASFYKDQLNLLYLEASSAEIERLFTETLDLTSHRLDAWVTALPYRRLLELRDAQVTSRLAPVGDVLGAYGWVEDVKPATRSTETIDGVGTCEIQANSGGFVHAPSMTHAATAAVLRSGHLSVRGAPGAADAGAYAVDLSSRRVRDGRRLFEGVRAGQQVGALLGYDLERRLHELGFDQLRFKLRHAYPLVANKAGEDPGIAAESIAARNVVDGAWLLNDHLHHAVPYGTNGLPDANSAEAIALVPELDRLAEAYDAAADLLTAEGVFQLVRGNVDAAVPTIDGVAGGQQPPETFITRSARGGIGIAHKVALVFPSNAAPTLPKDPDHPEKNWPTDATPRAAGEPTLNAWLGTLIGLPGDVAATLRYLDENGATVPSLGGESTVTVTLADLAIHPLDVLALAEAIAQNGKGSVLDRRIIAAGKADATRKPSAPVASYEVTYDVAGARRFPQVIEVLNTAGAFLGASRPLALADLLPPVEVDAGTEEAEDDGAHDNAAALYTRSVGAATSLGFAVDGLVAADGHPELARAALGAAALFAPLSAFPDPTVGDDALADAVSAAHKELKGRLDAVPGVINPDDKTTAELLALATQIFKTVFGANFLAVPDVKPPRKNELGRSLAARGTLLSGSDDAAPDRYLTQIMRARDKLARFRKLGLYARTFGLPRPRVDIVQLPYVPNERWLGLPFENPDVPPDEGRSALLLLNYTSGLDADATAWNGVLIDTWTEIIPNRVEPTGIAFNYEGPRSRAPQAVLVAVPATVNATQWKFEELRDALEQTIDLTRARAVDRELLGQGQVFPAAIFAANDNKVNVISSTFGGLVAVTDSEGLT